MTTGKYKKTDSFLHRCGSGYKLACILIFSIFLSFTSTYLGIGIGMGALFTAVKSGDMKLKEALSSLSLIVSVVASLFIINILVLERGFLATLLISFRLVAIVMTLVLLTHTTNLKELGEGIEVGLKPLGRIGFPYREVTTMITLALRFIPELKDEMQNVINSQICRGIDVDGSLRKRIKALMPLALNIFIISIRKSLNVAMAMDARGYSKRKNIIEKRKAIKEDRILVLNTIIISILMIYL